MAKQAKILHVCGDEHRILAVRDYLQNQLGLPGCIATTTEEAKKQIDSGDYDICLIHDPMIPTKATTEPDEKYLFGKGGYRNYSKRCAPGLEVLDYAHQKGLLTFIMAVSPLPECRRKSEDLGARVIEICIPLQQIGDLITEVLAKREDKPSR